MQCVDIETEEALGPNKPGEIWMRGPQMMKGYFKNPEATKDTMTEDGWLKSGTNRQLLFKNNIHPLISAYGACVTPAKNEEKKKGKNQQKAICLIYPPNIIMCIPILWESTWKR